MKAVILAGGKGTRMQPYTHHVPKPLILINGKPFLEYVILELYKANIRDICVIGCYKIEMLEEFIQDNYPEITVVNQGEPLGTGHAVLAARDFCKDDEFLILGGDNFFDSTDITKIASEQYCIGGVTVNKWQRYGILLVKNDLLISLVEKPENFIGNLANAGIYKVQHTIWPILEKLNPSKRGEIELTEAIDALAKIEHITVHILSRWYDLGKPEDIDKISLTLDESSKKKAS